MIVIIDENLPPSWKAYLAPFGILAEHWLQIGNPGDADEVLFSYAVANRAAILTQDLDFTKMLALHGARLPSVIQLRVDCPIPEFIGPAVLKVLLDYRNQLESGCLATIDAKGNRLRLLPLRTITEKT